jgi:hypothetical protein
MLPVDLLPHQLPLSRRTALGTTKSGAGLYEHEHKLYNRTVDYLVSLRPKDKIEVCWGGSGSLRI